MRTKLFAAFFCGFVLVGQIRSQEVVVARDAKPNAPEQATPASEPNSSGSSTSTEARLQGQGKKSGSAQLTIEQMRMAGALAAERLKSETRVQPARMTDSSNSQAAVTPIPAAFRVAKPARKETRVGQTSASRASNLRDPKSEVIGPVRPTMIETGRETPDAAGPAKAESGGGQPTTPQSANRPAHRQGAILAAHKRPPEIPCSPRRSTYYS
jgi:hypothetical protein